MIKIKGVQKKLVMTRTPLRISFAGGGTDLPDFYLQKYGAVLSTTINKYVYVTIKRHGNLFQEKYRLNYAETENVETLDEIKNNIARECLRLIPVDPPIYISTVADVPAASGLGSSSSFAVGLLNALHIMRGERVSAAQLAEEAVKVEVSILKNPIGKQDQYAAAYGGLNLIKFMEDDRVNIEEHSPYSTNLENLFNHIQMFWTGMSRESSLVLKEQKNKTNKNIQNLVLMRKQAEFLNDLLREDTDIKSIGELLHEGWLLKRNLASKVSSDLIDEYYTKAIEAGAYGGKICGAGGGGFLLFFTPQEKQTSVIDALKPLKELKVSFEPHGTSLVTA